MLATLLPIIHQGTVSSLLHYGLFTAIVLKQGITRGLGRCLACMLSAAFSSQRHNSDTTAIIATLTTITPLYPSKISLKSVHNFLSYFDANRVKNLNSYAEMTTSNTTTRERTVMLDIRIRLLLHLERFDPSDSLRPYKTKRRSLVIVTT